MSELPGGWASATGADLFDLVRGVSYDKSAARSQPGPDLVPVLRANNIHAGRLNRDDLVYVPSQFVASHQLLRLGDLVIASSSGSRTVVGKAAPATLEFGDAGFGAFCTVVRPCAPELAGWLRNFFRTDEYRSFVERVALGITINNLRGSDLAAVPICVPPAAEQQRIVERLDALNARTARARTDLDRIPTLAKRYKDAVLDAYYRVDVHANEPLKNITPKGASIIYGILQPGPDIPGGVPYVRPTEIVDGRLDPTMMRRTSPDIAQKYRRSTLETGDVLLSIVGTIGKVAIVPEELAGANITQSSCRIRPAPDRLFPEYLAYFLKSPLAVGQYGDARLGTAVPRLNLEDVREILIPLPTLNKQAEVVRQIDQAFAEIDRLTAEATAARKLLDRLDQAVLAKAFRGDLVHQDPADEPASVLLERIRAERAAAPAGARRGRKRSGAGMDSST